MTPADNTNTTTAGSGAQGPGTPGTRAAGAQNPSGLNPSGLNPDAEPEGVADRPRWAPPALHGGRMEAALRTLELEVNRRLDGLLQGNHLGLVPGPGSEPGEARPYQPGDDVRRMDWAVTARTTVPHIRETVADRELETWVAVDLSPSLDFGTAACEKRDLVVAGVAAPPTSPGAAATGSARWCPPASRSCASPRAVASRTPEGWCARSPRRPGRPRAPGATWRSSWSSSADRRAGAGWSW